MRYRKNKYFFPTKSILITLFLFSCNWLIAQINPNADNVIQIIHTDRLEVEGATKRLIGDIQMKQKDTYFFCDQATIIDKDFFAEGNVRIEKGDSIQISSNTLDYKGDKELAILKGNVILEQDIINQFDFDLATNIGYYSNGATIKDTTAILKSKKGKYDSNTKKAFFEEDVSVEADDFLLNADTLEHSLEKNISYFQGPTTFTSGANEGYTERGYFQHDTKYVELYENSTFKDTIRNAEADTIKYHDEKDYIELIGNAHYLDQDSFEVISDRMTYDKAKDFYTLEGKSYVRKNEQTIESKNANYNAKDELIIFWDDVKLNDKDLFLDADTVNYNQKTEYARAVSNVRVVDTSYNGYLYAQKVEYFKPEQRAIASENPYIIQYLESDSLILASDTLLTFVDSSYQDSLSQKAISCHNSVKIYKSDFQGLADSLTYHLSDSLITLYKDPIGWKDSTQFSADTIRLLLIDESLDNLHLSNNAFIINTDDMLLFNQIKGRDVKAFVKDKTLDRVTVEGNGESLYFIKDEDGGYFAKNKTICGSMLILFKTKELSEIIFYSQPEAKLLPIDLNISAPDNFLEGYNWNLTNRPSSFESIKKQ